MTANGRPVVAMLMYPGFTNLDLVGPHATWGMAMDIQLVWKTLDPVASDTGMRILPTATLRSCPADLDILFVPGGHDTADHLDDDEVLDFLATRGATARYVTSVCSGSLLLGAAGLLHGYRAGVHWTLRDLLAPLGAECVHERVVVDRNRITGGGVTAGIDFGLTVLAEIVGEEQARVTQLAIEYDPAPPADVGSPEKADPATLATTTAVLAGYVDRTRRAVDRAASRLRTPA